MIDIMFQIQKVYVQTGYKSEKIYSNSVKKVLAFYITSWYIIFTPETGEKLSSKGHKLGNLKIAI